MLLKQEDRKFAESQLPDWRSGTVLTNYQTSDFKVWDAGGKKKI